MPVHAARLPGWSSGSGRVLSRAVIGPLARQLPAGLVDEVLAECGAVQRRFRVLPSRFGVYFVLGLCLFRGQGYPAVLRQLVHGLEGRLGAAGWACPSGTALSRLRGRLGTAPFAALLGRLAGPLGAGDPAGLVCGLLAAGWDGTACEVPASPANVAALGRARGAHYPQARLVALVACRTRAVLAAALGPSAGRGSGERALARELLWALGAGMLVLADRGYYSARLWREAAATGADLLWRVSRPVILPVLRELPDGSWLSELPGPGEARRAANRRYYRKTSARPRRAQRRRPAAPGIPVRVIAFTLVITKDDGTVRTEPCRLITTLLSPAAAPAAELAAAYARRWAAGTSFAELKTYLRGAGTVLRSAGPDGVRQELWALLVIYQAIRIVICAAAAGAGLDPARVSFTTTLQAIRRHHAAVPGGPAAALAAVEDDILDPRHLVRPRPGRAYPRLTRRAALPPPPAGAPAPPPLPHHQTITITITPPAPPPPATHDQPQQPPQHPQASP